MDWDNLQVFLTITRTGRVSAAAKRLGVEHTTVSRRLEALEKELGVPLFYRTTTGYLLTSHGKNVVASAEAMERAAIAVAGRAREGSGCSAGWARYHLETEFASHWLAPAFPAFRAEHPQIELQILVGTRERDLTRGEAELSIQSPRPRQQGLVAVRIAHTTAALYTRSVRSAGTPLVTSVETLRGLPLLVSRQVSDLQHAKWFQPTLASATIGLEPTARSASCRGPCGLRRRVLPRFVAREDEDSDCGL